ncbi:androgen-dependent TFPI-regulating protein-like [Spodoptera litura]|uniref:Androgen-dependent TFPI-regulating protein-like n=1 Tax=Spodoptera litura TaxID=69820 RepID=A0A9J7IL81_SPOLT|nr:androgen-dependent TFPI-regulating protein-like [Spodoptera litura]
MTNAINNTFRVNFFKICGVSLLNVRLWLYSVAFVHLIVTAIVTLSIDVTVDEDPSVRAYHHVRWKLITCWFNLITLAYLPLCLYCDWCEKREKEPPHVAKLRVLRDVIMTSILMPTTTFADITFWVTFLTDASIIAPPRVFDYLPYWSQHSLHTVSMVTVIMDLLLTPRKRPDSMKPRLGLMVGFGTAYTLMVYVSFLQGEPVYGFLSTASDAIVLSVYLIFLILLTISFYVQWHIIDYVWSHKRNKNKIKVVD